MTSAAAVTLEVRGAVKQLKESCGGIPEAADRYRQAKRTVAQGSLAISAKAAAPATQLHMMRRKKQERSMEFGIGSLQKRLYFEVLVYFILLLKQKMCFFCLVLVLTGHFVVLPVAIIYHRRIWR